MKVDHLLSRLNKVKQTGAGTWIACCPAHDDKHPSLGIRETKDGVVLLRCYAQQCGVDRIADAVGIDLADLFPEALPGLDVHRGFRRPFPYGDVLEGIATEAEIIVLIAGDLREGRPVSDDDWARLRLARDRIVEAKRLAFS